MKTTRSVVFLSTCVFACLALPAYAADRVHAGQWDSTMTSSGHTTKYSMCISQSVADALNGDAKSIRPVMEKSYAGSPFKVTDVKANGDQIMVTVVGAGKKIVVTTTYHGDSSEAGDSNGTKHQSKRVGACK